MMNSPFTNFPIDNKKEPRILALRSIARQFQIEIAELTGNTKDRLISLAFTSFESTVLFIEKWIETHPKDENHDGSDVAG
jgi:hypothetical protein